MNKHSKKRLGAGRLQPVRSGLMQLAVLAGITLLALALALGGWTTWDARREARHEAERSLQNLAQALEQDIARNLELYDTALTDAISGLGLPGLSETNPELRHAVLFGSMEHAKYMASVLILNERGDIVFDSQSTVPRRANFADRDYFQVHRDRADVGLYTSRPFQSRLIGSQNMAVSRRIAHPDGSFAGVAVGGMQLAYFQDLFARLNLGAHGSVTLFRDDGVVLARWPHEESLIGRSITSGPVFEASRSMRFGVGEGRASLDGVKRLYAFRRVGDAPLIVSVALSGDEVFAGWRRKAAGTALALAAVIALAAVLAWALRRELRRRGRLETQLRDSEAGFRLLAENASDMVSRVGSDGRRNYVSPAASRIYGVTPDVLLGTGMLDRTCVEDRPLIECSMARLLSGAAEGEEIAFRALHPERGAIWVEGTASVVRDPVTGAPDGYVSILRDVTERRAAEDALSASEERFRLLAESTGDAITCLSLNFSRLYASPAFRVLFGYEPDEVVGDTPVAIIHPDDMDDVQRCVGPLAEGQIERTQVSYRIRHKQGHWVWTEASLSLARDDVTRQPRMIVCALRDISERKAQADDLSAANTNLERLARHLAKAREIAVEASRAKTRFLAGMSHELRTPLNGILGYAQLLRLEGGLNAKQSVRVDAMLEAGTHLQQMINGVLDLSQIEAGQLALQPEPIDPERLARACLDLVRPIAEAKQLTLSLIAVAENLPRVITDPVRLRQVMLNLLGNAVKFTNSGAVDMTVHVDATGLTIRVADTGPGVAAEDRQHLFQEFNRLAANGNAVEGSGLGLALSAKLVELMGGSIHHQDNPGGGSVFSLNLPLNAPISAGYSQGCSRPAIQLQVGACDSSEHAQLAAKIYPMQILVVDDVAMNRDIAVSFLRAVGHNATSVDCGERAVEEASAHDFDAILMDVRMPGMSGIEATRYIRKLHGRRGQVPIVALTAQAFLDQIIECRQAGMNGHLSKPYTEAALHAALTAAVRGNACDFNFAKAGGDVLTHEDQVEYSPDTSGEPVLDCNTFKSVAEILLPETLNSSLQMLIDRSQDLLHFIQADRTQVDSAEVAHTLAGSAGMFGFKRLSTVARSFERVLNGNEQRLDEVRTALVEALELSIDEMSRAPAVAEDVCNA